jgi:hypothetical protein
LNTYQLVLKIEHVRITAAREAGTVQTGQDQDIRNAPRIGRDGQQDGERHENQKYNHLVVNNSNAALFGGAWDRHDL